MRDFKRTLHSIDSCFVIKHHLDLIVPLLVDKKPKLLFMVYVLLSLSKVPDGSTDHAYRKYHFSSSYVQELEQNNSPLDQRVSPAI